MRRHVLVMLAVLPAVALPAAAAEYIPGWRSDVVWNSNVLATQSSNESDFSFRNGPTLRVREPLGNFTYDANYQLTYDAYTRLDGINEFDHFFTGEGAWRATPTTSFFLNDDFAYTSNLNAIFQAAGTGLNQVAVVLPRSERVTTNIGSVGMTHQFGPLWQLRVTGDNEYYNYQNPFQSDSLATSGTMQLTRSITPRFVLGGGARIERQEFGDVGEIAGRSTTFYQGFAVVQYNISPTLYFVGQGGPAYAVPDQPSAISVQRAPAYLRIIPSTCTSKLPDGTPVFRPTSGDNFGGCTPTQLFNVISNQPVGTVDNVPQASSAIDVPFVGEQQTLDSSLNYFGSLSLEKDWRLWHARIAYQRSASSASAIGTSTNLDVFSGGLTWRPTALWDVTFSGSYSKQTAISTGRVSDYALGTQCLQSASSIPISCGATTNLFVAPVGVPIEASLGAKLKNAYDISSYLMELRAARRISRRLTVDGSFSWFQQQNNGAAIVASNETIYRVVFGFTWNFDPIPLYRDPAPQEHRDGRKELLAE